MALSWTMDKLGPLCRSAEDCALVLDAIQGPDGKDKSAIPRHSTGMQHFTEEASHRLREERVRSADHGSEGREATLHPSKQWDDAALGVLRREWESISFRSSFPDLPYDAMRIILTAEAAAAFDELTRSNRDARAGAAVEIRLGEHISHSAIHSRGRITSTRTGCAVWRSTRGTGMMKKVRCHRHSHERSRICLSSSRRISPGIQR